MDKLNSFLEWCELTPISDYDSFFNGLFIGLFLLFLCLMMIYFVLLIFKLRRKCKGITICNESGELFITTGALKDFVRRALKDDLSQVTLSKIVLKKYKKEYKLKLAILVPHTSNVNFLKEKARELIFTGLSDRLALNSIKHIDITLKGFNGKKVVDTPEVVEVEPSVEEFPEFEKINLEDLEVKEEDSLIS